MQSLLNFITIIFVFICLLRSCNAAVFLARLLYIFIAVSSNAVHRPCRARCRILPRCEKNANRIPGSVAPPQSWPGGEVVPAGITAVMSHFSYSGAKPYKGTPRCDCKAPRGTKAGPRKIERFVNMFKIRHFFTDRFEVCTAMPVIDAAIKNHNADGNWRGGAGNAALMLRCGLKKRTEDSAMAFALGLAQPCPPAKRGRGKYLATNARIVIIGDGFSRVDDNRRVDPDARHAVYAEGAHGIEPGGLSLFHVRDVNALSNISASARKPAVVTGGPMKRH